MKILIFIFLFSHASFSAMTSGNISGCTEKGSVIAKEGDSFVFVKLHGKEWKLTSHSKEKFSLQSKKTLTFRSLDNDPMKGEPTLEFEMPGMMENTAPHLVLSYSGVQHKCRVDLHESGSKK